MIFSRIQHHVKAAISGHDHTSLDNARSAVVQMGARRRDIEETMKEIRLLQSSEQEREPRQA